MVLKCLHYNYNNTETCTDSYERCAREVTCPNEIGHHCFVVWQVGSNSSTSSISAGCNPPYQSAPDEKCGKECVGQSRGPRYYCCCSDNLCNRNFKLPPKPQVSQISTSTTTSSSNNLILTSDPNKSSTTINNQNTTDSVLWAVIPFVLTIIVLTYIYKTRKRLLNCTLGRGFNHNNININNNNNNTNNNTCRRNNGRELTASELNELRINDNNDFSIITPFRKSGGINGAPNGAQIDGGDFVIGNNNINNDINNIHHLQNNSHYHLNNNNNNNTDIDHLDNNNSTKLPLTNHHDANNQVNIIDLKSIKLLEIIGSGRFGTVHRAKLMKQLNNNKTSDNDNIENNDESTNDNLEESEIAVKIISSNDEPSWSNEQEVYRSAKIKHENILNYFYSGKDLESKTYWLIVEYASKGSLYCYLTDNLVNWKEFSKISLGIVNGLSHLHEADIAHRDFKSKNVLLKHDLTPCITDFGVAAILESTPGSQIDHRKKYLQVGTPRYMAPEVLECSVTFTKSSFTKIDVYALSLVLWELISRCCLENDISENSNLIQPYKLPFEDMVGPNPDINEMRQIVVVDKIRPVLKDEWRRTYPLSEFCRAIEDGWEYDHDARISASCFVERVGSLLNSC